MEMRKEENKTKNMDHVRFGRNGYLGDTVQMGNNKTLDAISSDHDKKQAPPPHLGSFSLCYILSV